ncbi:TraK family protein [Pasteurella multocida]
MNEKEFISALANAKVNTKLKSRHVILAYKKHIMLALKDGYSCTDIFNLLKDRGIYPYSYDAFRKALRIVIDTSSMNTIQSEELSSNNSDVKNIRTEEKKSFDFNPKVISTKELI